MNQDPNSAQRVRHNSSRGVALIIVTFVIALAIIVVINLTYNSYMAARANLVAERSVQAEYLLKSIVNLARVLIQQDQSDVNSRKSLWGPFVSGQNLDPNMLGLSVPGLQIEVEINSEDSKVPFPQVRYPDPNWRDVLRRLFEQLGFDKDNDAWKVPPFAGQFFDSKQTVANLIDYIDQDTTSYSQDGFKGIESELDEKEGFPNHPDISLDDLQNIPGFTPTRLRKALPYLTTHGNKQGVNVNLASRTVLKALHEDITDAQVDEIISFRDSKDGPFSDKSQFINKVSNLDVGDIRNQISAFATYGREGAGHYEVIAKVAYGNATFFMRAYLDRYNRGELPNIYSIELF